MMRHRRCLAFGLLLGAIGALAGADIIDSSSMTGGNGGRRSSSVSVSSSSSTRSNNGMACNSASIIPRGNLSVSAAWSESAPLTLDFEPLGRGQCVGYIIGPEAVADTACAARSPDSYILVEFWQLGSNDTIPGGSLSGPGSGPNRMPKVPYAGNANELRVLAARGTKPTLSVGVDSTVKITPPVRDPATGLTPVGSFQDDAGVVFNRPALRVMFPTDSPVTDVGDPADPNTWYITIANMADQPTLPAYALRAACITPNAATSRNDARSIGDLASRKRNSSAIISSSSSSISGGGSALLAHGMPCPVPAPGGKQCNGHGVCRVDSSALAPEYSRYCDCDSGWGSFGCQLQLLSLPLNAEPIITAIIAPGKWGYWEVSLPGARGPAAPAAAAAAGGGGSSGGNEQLLLTAERVPGPGFGGNPLLFLKPFGTKDHNEPALDAMSVDVANWADLRGFQLQLNRQFISYRLPLREGRSTTSNSPVARQAAMPLRWYVAVYNSNATRLSEPVKIKLSVQYRDLNRQPVACPFDCSGHGRCIDPLSPLQSMRSSTQRQGLPGPPGPQSPHPGSGLNPDPASMLALGPLQDQSPLDAGFMCACNQGFGGLLCEGRVQNLTVGSGEQKLGPEVLEPGSWFYYLVTVDQGFNPASNDLGIQWVIGEPSSPPSNYSNAYISFDQGPLHRQQLMGVDGRMLARRGMTPYSKLIPRGNPPLPLQVPGSQLSPGGSYVVSIFNNDYAIRQPFIFGLSFYVMADSGPMLHPYMSILLGVTAAVILCLAMTLCKRIVIRYGILPWRWRRRRQELAAAAAAGGAGGPNSLALVLMAQGSQQSHRGVPPEISTAFPCRRYAVKDYQRRHPELATAAAVQQHQQQPPDEVLCVDDLQGQDQNAVVLRRQPVVTRDDSANRCRQQQQQQRRHSSPMATAVTATVTSAVAAAGDIEMGHPTAAAPAPAVAAGEPGTEGPAAAAACSPQQRDGLTSWGSAKEDDLAATDTSKQGVRDALKDDDAPSCAVCLCEYVTDELVRELPCSHEFHQSCIDQWMASHGTCPICRAPLWHGAVDLEDEQAGSDNDRGDRPAAIYVHHDMPAGGFMGPAGLGAGVAGAQQQQQQLTPRDWARALDRWRHRRRQQQQRQQQQWQQDVEEQQGTTALPTEYQQQLPQSQNHQQPQPPQQQQVVQHRQQRRRQQRREQDRQQAEDSVAAGAATGTAAGAATGGAAGAATGGADGSSSAAAAGDAGAGALAASAGSGSPATERFMGAFSLGRRRQ